jgi:peptidoglycan hydrolase-like protein with peptidoglycan-binding domain
MQCTGIAPAAWRAGLIIGLLLLLFPASPAAAESGEVSASSVVLIPSAGWHGRAIRDPQPAKVAVADRPPRGWAAGPVGLGTGSHSPSGSRRVREVQRRLRSLGYRPGPVDGIFGVRTRAAVAWFQVKHGFPVSGNATFAVVRHLRARTSGAAKKPEAPPAGDTSPQVVTPRPAPVQPVVVETSNGPSGWLLACLLLLAFAIGFAGVALLQRSRRRPVLPTEATRALGYARVESPKRMKAHATTIAERCADRGMALTGLITDDVTDERPGRVRPGLEHALQRLRSGEADCLVVGRIGHLTRSPAELMELLDSMSERETPLVVLNAGPARPTRRWADGEREVLARRRQDG